MNPSREEERANRRALNVSNTLFGDVLRTRNQAADLARATPDPDAAAAIERAAAYLRAAFESLDEAATLLNPATREHAGVRFAGGSRIRIVRWGGGAMG